MRFLELKVPPLVVFVAFGALMWWMARKFPVVSFSLPGADIVALLFVAIGFGVAVFALVEFHRHQTTFHPNRPAEAAAIVTSSVYRYSRNPMYLGLAFGLAAWAVHLGNWAAVACIAGFVAYMTVFQIKPEERCLAEKFGETFDEYLKSVRRWI